MTCRISGVTSSAAAQCSSYHSCKTVTGQGQRVSNSLKSQDFGEEVRIHQAADHFAPDTILDGVTLEQRHREAAQPAQVVPQRALPGAAVILAEVDVQDPVQRL